MKKRSYLLGVAAAASIALAGCSSTSDPASTAPIVSGGATTGTTPSSTASTGAARPPTIGVGALPPSSTGSSGTGSFGGGTGGAIGGAAGGGGTIAPAVGAVGAINERTVFFEFDSNDVSEKYRPMLQAHAGFLSKNVNSKLKVEGNTDERGSREYNLALGQRRAESVKRMLVLMGARDSQIETVSLGEEKPRRTGKSEADYAENRRGDLLYGN
jgi:peptidoglycan-associated lipoprotein